MTKKVKKGRPLTKKTHLKHVGIEKRTLERYEVGTKRFFTWLRLNRLAMPADLKQLDEFASEFVNDLYLDDRPLHWAMDFACGIRRLYPKCNRELHTTTNY